MTVRLPVELVGAAVLAEEPLAGVPDAVPLLLITVPAPEIESTTWLVPKISNVEVESIERSVGVAVGKAPATPVSRRPPFSMTVGAL